MKKAIRFGAIAVAALVAALLIYALSNALYTKQPVGFQLVAAPDPGGSALTVGVWYPTDGRPLPTTLLGLNLISVARDGPMPAARCRSS